MTLVEVVVALGLMVLLFSMFAIFLDSAGNMNKLAKQNDAQLAEAEANVYSSGSTSVGSVTFTEGGGTDYTYNVDIIEGASADGELTLRRFEP